MEVEWADAALLDIERLHRFLATVNPQAAARFLQLLRPVPEKLKANPQQGPALDQFTDREVRRLLIGQYEMRYEVAASTIFILRIWHTREDR